MSRPAWFIGPWHLHRSLACVPEDRGAATLVLVESIAKGRALPWHRKKLVLVVSAMRHFAAELREDGYDVEIVRAKTYVDGIRDHVQRRGSTEVHALRPCEWGLDRALEAADFGVPLHLHDDGGPGGSFLVTRGDLSAWASAQRSTWRMDSFYRWMRQRTGDLMVEGKPVGGKYSYDADNRKKVPKGVVPPGVPTHPPDAITREVMDMVEAWDGYWGSAEGFDWPVTRAGAQAELDHFVQVRLPNFGNYQDAMVTGEPWLWHARLSAAINVGLLHPRDVADAAIAALHEGHAPLNAVEGFVRQVIGWREFMRAVYLERMPDLRSANLLGATRPLPAAYWDPDQTDMHCLSESVRAVRDHGYAHHIQRLMILGNYALLLGVEPLALSHWFWAAFVDAYEWVELPNVHGMALYADDTFTTKPYAASANYVHKMGDYCTHCTFDRRKKHGEGACPLNPLFWDFMVRHRPRLSQNHRLKRLYGTWERKSEADREATLRSAAEILAAVRPADHGWTFDDDAG